MSGLEVSVIEEIKIKVPLGALSNAATETLGKSILNAAQDGYEIKRVRQLDRHDQREGSYVVGFELILGR